MVGLWFSILKVTLICIYVLCMYIHVDVRKYDKMITHMYYDIDISRKTTNFLVTKTNIRKSNWFPKRSLFTWSSDINYTDSIFFKKNEEKSYKMLFFKVCSTKGGVCQGRNCPNSKKLCFLKISNSCYFETVHFIQIGRY